MSFETSGEGGGPQPAGPWSGGSADGGSGSGAAAPPPERDSGEGGFTGRAGPLLGLMSLASLLTVITLGIYRFWMKTRLRQYYWSNFRIGGEPFEYTGRGLELLLGFFIAIFFLAIYLFVVNFALSFYSMAYWQGFEPAVWLSALVAAPLMPYAQYRAQRYLLARTRWRGIRFGLELAAWRYAGVALLWWLASALTLGLIWPTADFQLRRFITKRSQYGDLPMRLNGRAAGLYRGFLVPYLLMAATIATFFLFGGAALFDPTTQPQDLDPRLFVSLALYLVASFSFIWYSAFRLRYFLNRTEVGHTETEPGARAVSTIRPGRFLGVTIGGGLLTVLIITAIGALLAVVAGVLIAALGASNLFQGMPQVDPERGFGPEHLAYVWPMLLVFAVVYLVIFLVAAVCFEVLISRRLIRHVAETLRVENIEALARAKQRSEDAAHQAEGFADALDVGAF